MGSKPLAMPGSLRIRDFLQTYQEINRFFQLKWRLKSLMGLSSTCRVHHVETSFEKSQSVHVWVMAHLSCRKETYTSRILFQRIFMAKPPMSLIPFDRRNKLVDEKVPAGSCYTRNIKDYSNRTTSIFY